MKLSQVKSQGYSKIRAACMENLSIDAHRTYKGAHKSYYFLADFTRNIYIDLSACKHGRRWVIIKLCRSSGRFVEEGCGF